MAMKCLPQNRSTNSFENFSALGKDLLLSKFSFLAHSSGSDVRVPVNRQLSQESPPPVLPVGPPATSKTTEPSPHTSTWPPPIRHGATTSKRSWRGQRETGQG